MAAAIGAGLPIADPVASTVVDIGGGTTEVAVISLGSMVVWRSLPVGGYEMDDAIVGHVRRQHSLEIGEGGRAAEDRDRLRLGGTDESHAEANGRDVRTGGLRQAVVSAQEAREALEPPVMQVIDAVRETLERTPPELSSDISERGIVLAGGGVLLRGFPERLRAETGLGAPCRGATHLRRPRGRPLPRRARDDRPLGQRGQTGRAPRRWTVAFPTADVSPLRSPSAGHSRACAPSAGERGGRVAPPAATWPTVTTSPRGGGTSSVLACAIRNRGLCVDRGLRFHALELALVDVALLRRPELAAGELSFVDGVVELAWCDAVADPADVGELALEGEVQLVVRGRAGRQYDRVDIVDRVLRSGVQVEERDTVALDACGPLVQAVSEPFPSRRL